MNRLETPTSGTITFEDTVITDPNSVTRILVYFPTADELGFDPDATFPAAVNLPGDVAGAGVAYGGHGGHADPGGAGGHESHGTPPGIDRFGGDYIGSIAPPAAHHRSDTLQGYVWHCHILDHEDHDMMLPYRTVT